MIVIYTTDAQRVYSGELSIDPAAPIPAGACLTQPPATTGTEVAQCLGGVWTVLPAYPVTPSPPFDRAAASLQIDNAVADIYGRFTRFGIEYEERETQALAYKTAGYTGPVPPRVSEFATPAGMPAKAATDLILSQSANLRTAQGALSALRMRKYEVLRAATDAQAQAAADAILQSIAAVGAQVS